MNAWLLVLSLVLIALNGVFVAIEFAVVASRRTKIETLAQDGSASARFALEATSDVSLQLAGAQLGVTMASLALGAVAEPTLASAFDDVLLKLSFIPDGVAHGVAFALALALVVFVHTVFGEMVPRAIALSGPERALLRLSVPNRAYIAVFRPFIRALNATAGAALRVVGVEARDEVATVHSSAEIATLLAVSRDEGLVEASAHDLLTGALDFGERVVAEVMVPRDRLTAVTRSTSVADAESVIVESGHSRLIVYGRDLDDVVGFVHAKDLLTVAASARSRPIPQARIRSILKVDPDRPLDAALVDMRRSRTHVAVVGEQHATMGLLTLEDVLEDLVGDIRDETDRGPRR